MLLRQIVVVLLLMFSSGPLSHSVTLAKLRSGTNRPIKHTLLWRITSPGSSDTSYLFGTLHLLERSFVDTLPHVIESFEKSDVVYGEMVLDCAVSDELHSMLDTGSSLQATLTAKQYAIVSKEFTRIVGVPLRMFDSYPPVAIYALLMVSAYGKTHPENVHSHLPMDLYLQNKAKSEHKEIRGLESLHDQAAALFDSLSDSKETTILLDFVKHEKRELRMLDALVKNYEEGNIDVLLNKDDIEELDSREMEALVYERNSNWIKELSEVLDTTKAFIAVGAGHLSGPKGLIAGLRKHGFRVEPMPMKKGAED